MPNKYFLLISMLKTVSYFFENRKKNQFRILYIVYIINVFTIINDQVVNNACTVTVLHLAPT